MAKPESKFNKLKATSLILAICRDPRPRQLRLARLYALPRLAIEYAASRRLNG